MAIVTPGVLGDALRGKIGNAVFSRTRYGIVVRAYKYPKNPKTPAQQANRANFTRAVAAWRSLTPPEKEAWAKYAATQVVVNIDAGTSRRPTAYAVFLSRALAFLKTDPSGVIPVLPPD